MLKMIEKLAFQSTRAAQKDIMGAKNNIIFRCENNILN
jgi:hypothetical protein